MFFFFFTLSSPSIPAAAAAAAAASVLLRFVYSLSNLRRVPWRMLDEMPRMLAWLIKVEWIYRYNIILKKRSASLKNLFERLATLINFGSHSHLFDYITNIGFVYASFY